ncbi:hypothetical protein [Christiangramia flava]|uniref:Uncharacterized protein n=1 Tax=Christiangramia flava JLT2011 TaxID=1229726 RepID=A0A1L7HZH3_9FLAO|nr:hypothetical protein [Christiangramia flava]APU66747.1 hypothetical protein GRFL_0023 [Christiangramia flava JLT2011]OSS38384.1 hypothetical protein C723_2621 [Christiangramia flava JLT2011]
MPKNHTFPTLFDEVLQLNISKLKQWEYLKSGQVRTGTITWSRNGTSTGSISIKVNTYSNQPYIELDYKFREEPRNYKVNLVSIPSNLGKGVIWYFLCPETNKRCRKLYSVSGYFLHRQAFRGCMYESQTKSKTWRQIEKVYGSYFDSEKNYELLYSKHFKKFYNGKPTKRYLKLMKRINEADRFTLSEIEQLFHL